MTQKPTKEEMLAAVGQTVPDIIAPGLRVLFCGINPGLYTAVVGHHFARPGNRFWPTLFAAGFTPRLLQPSEERTLLEFGYGITNVVERATASASKLSVKELREGGRQLEAKIRHFCPEWLAVLGIGAYRDAFQRPDATIGPQAEQIGGAKVWVLPNPSGLNAHYPPRKLAELFRELRRAAERNNVV